MITEEGNRYVRLKVLGYVGSGKWECVCDCGKVKVIKGSDLRRGHDKSCGCYSRDLVIERNTVHGMRRNPLYNTWRGMKERCTKPSHKHFKDYGGRGITYCAAWEDFETFMVWALINGYKHKLQLDRYPDNDGNYCPDNCRFVPPIINRHSGTRVRGDNRTGFTGVEPAKAPGRYLSRIGWTDSSGLAVEKHLGVFDSIKEAVLARNSFIKVNKLPHQLQEASNG